MMFTWVFYCLVVSAAVAASALAFEVAARAIGLPRRVAWATALGGMLLLPLALPLLASTARAPETAVADGGAMLRLPAITVTAGLDRMPLLTDAAILAALIGAGVVGVGVLMVAHRRLRRIAREWNGSELDGVAVRISGAVGPAVFGWRHPVIVLPQWVAELDAPQRRMILAHEMEHVRANDSLLLNAARLLVALVPWNPVAWLAYRRLQLAVEFDCDRRVLSQAGDALAYADTLLDVGRRAATHVPAFRVALTEPSSFLSRRITAMLTQPFRSPRLVAAGAAAAGALLLAVACATREPLGTVGEKPVHQVPEVVVTTDTSVARATTERPFFDFQVDQPARPIPGNAAPRYPDSLRTAMVEGEVLVQFVVDDEGRPDTLSFKVLKASSEEFVRAVRAVLPGMRFTAARVGGRAVRQLVQQPFAFALAK